MPGYHIDPRIVPDTQREHAVLAEIKRRSLTAHKLHADGSALRVAGPGVFLLAARLRDISPADLRPFDPEESQRRADYMIKAAAPRRAAATV